MIPRDEPFFLRRNARRLFAVWQGVTDGPRAAVLFCHPFGEEKKCAHRAFVETARALAALQIASLRFDFSACGDSDGEFRDVRLNDWLDDIRAAWSDLSRRTPGAPRLLLGLRLGAAIAAEACDRLPDLAALILWQPVLNGRAEFSTDLRRILIQQMIVDGKSSMRRSEVLAAFESGQGEIELDGFPVTAHLYRDICTLDLVARAKSLPPACGVLQFTRPNPRIEHFLRSSGAAGTVAHVPPIWRRSDFIPGPATGETLAREGVLPWLNED